MFRLSSSCFFPRGIFVSAAFAVLCVTGSSYVRAEIANPESSLLVEEAPKREDLMGWFYDSEARVYTYVILKPGNHYEILTTRKGGEEIGRRNLSPDKNDTLRQMLKEIDQETDGGATEGYEWTFSPALMRLKEALEG